MSTAYDDPAFVRLLRTGRGLSKPYPDTMNGVALHRLHERSDTENAAIRRYLTAAAVPALS